MGLKSILWVSLPADVDPDVHKNIADFLKKEFENDLDCHVLVSNKPVKIETYGVYCIKIPYWFVRFMMWLKPKNK